MERPNIPPGQSVARYVKKFPEVLPSARRKCPACGGRLNGHGRRWRWVVSLEGVFRVPIQRLICTLCRKTTSLMPGMLFAYRQCTRALVFKIAKLREMGRRSMSDVRHMLVAACGRLKSRLSLSSLYRWAAHTT